MCEVLGEVVALGCTARLTFWFCIHEWSIFNHQHNTPESVPGGNKSGIHGDSLSSSGLLVFFFFSFEIVIFNHKKCKIKSVKQLSNVIVFKLRWSLPAVLLLFTEHSQNRLYLSIFTLSNESTHVQNLIKMLNNVIKEYLHPMTLIKE